MRTPSSQRELLRQLLLALFVLSLSFLNFGHTSAVFAAGGRVVVTGTSICGDHDPTQAGEHFACHACRQDAVALPPPPAVAAPVCFDVATVVYAPLALPPAFALETFPAQPRGPPSLS